MTPSPPASPVDRLAVGYQLKLHLLGISPQISRRVLVRGDTTLAELHHIFQVVMGWENWHLHCFHLWGKDYGIGYAGGTWVADDARRVHLDDFPWRVNNKFTYTYDFGDYWQHQVRVEKVLAPTAVPTTPVCVSGRLACPPEEVGGPAATTSARSTSSAGSMKLMTAYWPARISERTTYRPGSGPIGRSTLTKAKSIENWPNCIN